MPLLSATRRGARLLLPLSARAHPSLLRAACADDLEAVIEREGSRTIAAFVAEPILGASAGAAVPPDDYTRRVRETCRRHGIVFIDDEVMTGFGRTGRWFGIEWSGAAPDLVTCGKGMAGGYMPVGAVLASEAIVETVERAGGFVNGFTFSHHPVTAAAALATLEILEREHLVERAAVAGERALARLQALRARPQVGDVRVASLRRSQQWSSTLRYIAPGARLRAVGVLTRGLCGRPHRVSQRGHGHGHGRRRDHARPSPRGHGRRVRRDGGDPGRRHPSGARLSGR